MCEFFMYRLLQGVPKLLDLLYVFLASFLMVGFSDELKWHTKKLLFIFHFSSFSFRDPFLLMKMQKIKPDLKNWVNDMVHQTELFQNLDRRIINIFLWYSVIFLTSWFLENHLDKCLLYYIKTQKENLNLIKISAMTPYMLTNNLT